MRQAIIYITLVVRDYDEIIEFYTNKLCFTLVEDTYQPQQGKRWIVVSPPGNNVATILLAKASKPWRKAFIGDQTGDRIFLFLATDDLRRDYGDMRKNSIHFVREPREADYGTVAASEDLCRNLWDLVQFQGGHPMCKRL